MSAYAEGDDSAFAVVYDELSPRLLGYVVRATGSPDAAKDIVQQVFLNMYRARRRFVVGSRVEPWVYAIARRLIIDWGRASSGHLFVDDVDARGSAVFDESPERITQAREVEAAVRRELQQVPAPMREAFLLTRIEGLSPHDAAAILGITAAAAKLRAHRVARKLRAQLAVHFAAGEP